MEAFTTMVKKSTFATNYILKGGIDWRYVSFSRTLASIYWRIITPCQIKFDPGTFVLVFFVEETLQSF